MGNKIKVVISGIHYPLCMMRYFIEAFRRREDIELQTAGPFTGNWIPWQKEGSPNGMRLPMKYVKSPDVPLPQTFIPTPVASTMVAASLPWIPDLWLQIDAGWHFTDKPRAGIVAHVGTDPHVLSDFYRPAKRLSDVCFNMQTPYMEKGDVLLPYAADPLWHAPLEIPKEYDCVLIGLHYPHRNKLVQALRGQGISVFYDIGQVYDEYREANSKARIALSWSSLKDTPARVYEGMSMGCLVANRTDDLTGQFVEGEHFLGFDDVNEAVRQVERLLSDEHLRDEIHGNSFRKIQAQHLWDHRVVQILDRCGLC